MKKIKKRILPLGIILVVISQLCSSDFWVFNFEFGSNFLGIFGILLIFEYTLNYFGILQKEDGKWVWKTKREK